MFKILFAEDCKEDAEIVQHELRGLALVEQADTRDKFKAALDRQWDAILVDLRMPDLDGDDAMALAKEVRPEVPIIIVTGSVDDETASISCQRGAVDYLRKDRLRRLRIAVQQAVEKATLKRENEERKNREMRGQRLELLGEMVGGLSHDLRNVLSVILAGIEIIRSKGADEQRILDVMTSSVRRAEQMLAQILAFGRSDSGELHKVSTQYVVGEIATLLRAGTFPTNILVQITTAIGTAEIRCDENQINRALWNLCLNARDAMMPGGGQLTIAAQNITQPEGQFVLISIRDTGSGIPKEAMARLFEPFFTTKGSKGTGLGLVMAQQIIAAHGGKIGVTSGTSGTEFQIYLPVAGEVKSNVPDFDGGGKTILLCEDEDFLRAWGKLRLENANYRVLDAPNGAAAMNLFLANLDSVDALVTDLNMPVMTGDKLATALLELKKDLKIVYITGLARSETYHPVPSAILEKPFASVRLLETLNNILA